MIDQYIRQYGKRLYGLCLYLCTDPYDADDLYQDTWMKVVKNISQYSSDKPFEPWLTRICVNTYRNTLRRIARSPIFNYFHDNEEKDAAIEGVFISEGEDYSSLHEAIDRLPEKYRVTVLLYYFQEMDIHSTAEVLGIPPGTVKSRLCIARKKLKEVLENEADLQF
ncbi:MAG: RNA polymerase sigma factor [Lachnospiraceae bacterium]|nr:RNA polymerase sigma factor [Lachnospiraceae bacterium]